MPISGELAQAVPRQTPDPYRETERALELGEPRRIYFPEPDISIAGYVVRSLLGQKSSTVAEIHPDLQVHRMFLRPSCLASSSCLLCRHVGCFDPSE